MHFEQVDTNQSRKMRKKSEVETSGRLESHRSPVLTDGIMSKFIVIRRFNLIRRSYFPSVTRLMMRFVSDTAASSNVDGPNNIKFIVTTIIFIQ
jgi:hypothetical protein